MRYFVIVLVLAISVALVKSQNQAASDQAGGGTDGPNGDGSVSKNDADDMSDSPSTADGDGSVDPSTGAGGQIGGCSVGASGSGSAGDGDGSADGSASANYATPGAGYTYVINATRTENVIAPGYPVAYMYYQVSPTQNLIWFRSVGPKYPLMIEGYIHNEDKVYFSNDEDNLLNSCEKQPDGTWLFVLIELVKKTVLLGNDCSVEKGNYIINKDVDPITVTFPEKINCGNYGLIFNGLVSPTKEDLSKEPKSKWTWGFQLYFSFEIPDDGNCN